MRTNARIPTAEAAEVAPVGAVLSYATCPLCHTPDAVLTEAALAAGGAWRCATCSAHWDVARIATVTAYRVWVREHRPAPRAT